MGNAATDRIAIQCNCGVKLKVPATAVGRRAKCPKCGEHFTVQAPATEPAEVPVAPADDWLGDLASHEQVATETAAQPTARVTASAPPRPCPHCGTPLIGGAVMCTSCGYNLQTGRQVKAARTGPSVAGVAAKTAKVAGTFILGCVLSVVAAALGAGVWYFIAMKTGYEIGYVAWGIGLVTGFGMAVGSRASGFAPGAVAAAIAFASIVAAKFLIFATILYGAMTGNTTDPEIRREYVIEQIAAATLREEGIDPEEQTEAQYESARADAERRVKAMTGAELDREYERLRAAEDAEEDAELAKADAGKSEKGAAPPGVQEDTSKDAGVPSVSVVGIFFSAMFGLMDVLFVGLAVVSAYKVGASGLQFGGSS